LSPPPDPDGALRHTLQAEQVLAHGRSLAVIPLATGAVAAGLATMLWPQPSRTALLLWLCGIAATLALRFVVRWRIEVASRTKSDPARWLRWHRMAVGCNGLAWTALAVLMHQLPAGPAHDTIVFALAVLLAGSVFTTSFDRVASLLFALPVSVPALLHVLLHLGGRSPVIVGMAALFALTLAAVALQGHRVFRGQIRRRLELQASVEQAQRDALRLERVGALARIGAWEFKLRDQTLHLSSQTRVELGLSGPGPYTIEAVLDRIEPAFREPLRQAFERSIEERQAFTLEVATVQPSSGRGQLLVVGRPVVDGTRVLRVEGAIQDITRYTEMDQALSQSRSELQAVLQVFPGLISAIDEAGRYVYVNAAMAQTLGHPAAAVLGRTLEEVLAPGHAARLRADLPRLTDSPSTEVIRLPAPDGHAASVVQMSRIAGHPDAAGRRRYYAFGFDITELERTQQQLRQAKDDAERASQAKTQFLSQMSHELRTPLNAILGFGQLLGSDPRQPLAATQRQHLHEIMSGAQHLLNLINGLLDLGRIESGHLALTLQPLVVSTVVREALAMMRALADRQGVRLPQDFQAPDDLWVQADRTRLLQVLLNLLGNAIKYNRMGGEVTIVWSTSDGDLRLGVRDDGPGLGPDDQARLFQPFERLGAESSGIEGTGIGLALSRRLMHAMQGDIDVDSAAGRGSTFWLRLPTALPGAQDGVDPGSALTSAPLPDNGTPDLDATLRDEAGTSRPMTVLCIEDNAVNLLVLEAMLSRVTGLQMLSADSGALGLQQARASRPDLILTDIQMPGMDGFELMARLQADPLTRDIPVAALSADALASSVDRGRSAGFIDYLTKPLEMDAMHALLRRVRDRRVPS
jgi:PAS domain S-box-containing protein